MIKPCKDMTMEDWKEVLLYLNPNMEMLNNTPPKHDEELICHCKKCNGIFYRFPQKVKDNVYRKIKTKTETPWCPICNGKQTYQGFNDLATVRPDLVSYFKNPEDATKYTIHSSKYVELVCPFCHTIKKMTVADLVEYGFHCKICDSSTSYPNKFCRVLLSLLPVDEYDVEYVDSWTQGKKYDGYFKINDKKYLLEFDGLQHFRDSSWSTKKEQQENDKLKTKLAKENGFLLIRIDCRNTSFLSIKNQVYKSKLSSIFDLDSIDWNYIYNKASIGAFKEIVDFYNMTPLLNTEISKYLGYSACTIGEYLRKADALGMVDYRPCKVELDVNLVKELCSFFIDNQNYSNKELSKKFGINSTRVMKYLRRGLKDGLINLSQFTKEAFEHGRFSDLSADYYTAERR